MFIRIHDLESVGINRVFKADSAYKFAAALVGFVTDYCHVKAFDFLPVYDPLRDDYAEQIASHNSTVQTFIRQYVENEDNFIEFVPDEKMLKLIEDKMYIRAACERHFDDKIGSGISGIFKTYKHQVLMSKVAIRNDVQISVQGVYQAMTALFVRRGFGTPEQLAELVRSIAKH